MAEGSKKNSTSGLVVKLSESVIFRLTLKDMFFRKIFYKILPCLFPFFAVAQNILLQINTQSAFKSIQ